MRYGNACMEMKSDFTLQYLSHSLSCSFSLAFFLSVFLADAAVRICECPAASHKHTLFLPLSLSLSLSLFLLLSLSLSICLFLSPSLSSSRSLFLSLLLSLAPTWHTNSFRLSLCLSLIRLSHSAVVGTCHVTFGFIIGYNVCHAALHINIACD